MVKKYLLLIIMFMCFGICNVFGIEDREGPVLNKVSINSSGYMGGDNITVNVDASDNLTGISSFDIEFRLKTDLSKKIILNRKNPTDSSVYSYTMNIPENATPGVYEAFAIQIWDGAGNLTGYSLSDVEKYNFFPIEFTVYDNGKDYTPPVLVDVSVSTKTMEKPGPFTLTAKITDDKSEIHEVEYTYLINNQRYYFYATKKSEDTFVATSTFNEEFVSSDALFVSLIIRDKAGNSSKFVYDISRDISLGDFIQLNTNLDVVYTNKMIDNDAPKLKSYSYSSNKATIPGSIDINLEFEKDTSGISDAKIYFMGYNKDNEVVDYLILYPTINGTKATFKIAFDHYTPDSTFFVEKIELWDRAGNSSTYTVNDDDFLDIEKKIITLTKAITGDVITSTSNNDYVDLIQKTDENKTITIDTTKKNIATKNIFDSIKNTNKSVILVNDGIQWIFNGKDIINETKDINTKINIYKVNEYGSIDFREYFDKNNNAVVIEFANNGLLPGKALIKIKADYSLKDYIGIEDLYVYHSVNSNNSLETIAEKISVTEDGFYEFYITHNSKYIISKKTAKREKVVSDNSSALGNNDIPEEEVQGETKEEIKEEIQDKKEGDKVKVTSKKSYKNIILISIFSVMTIILVAVSIYFIRKIKYKKKANGNKAKK